MTRRYLASVLVALGAVRASAAQDAPRESSPTRERDAAAIKAEILRGAEAFMAGNPDVILEHYAKDVVLTYPGIPDQDYATLAKGYAQIRNRPPGMRVTTRPTFEEILVSGDLAIVRVTWNTTVITADSGTASRRLRDLQVWRREPDGRWMFIRGMHFREPVPDSARGEPAQR
jgi:ketosteroid isomerase-like protein